MSKSVVQVSVTAASVCLAALSAVASINDALVYDMALVPTDGPVTKNHIYNRLTHSAATRVTAASVSTFSGATDVCGTPDPITITEETITVPGCNGGITYTEPVLWFPQSETNVEGQIWTYKQGVKLQNVPVSSNMTVYCRMRLDPSMADSAYDTIAEPLMDFNWTSGNNSTTAPFGFKFDFKLRYGMHYFIFNYDYSYNKQWSGYVNIPQKEAGVWFDYVLVLQTDDPDEGTTMRVYARYDGKAFKRSEMKSSPYDDETVPFLLPFNGSNEKFGKVIVFKSNDVSLGTAMSAVNKTAWEKIDKLSARQTFRGGISRFRVYNRPFTTAEARGLLSEANGGVLLVGREDGRAEEFAAADEADVPAAFDPYTMQSSQLRGTLTAANPSVTIDCLAKGPEQGLCKVLTVKPLLGDLGAGTPSLDVAVNGRKVGTLDLVAGKSASFYVRGRDVQTNANGVIRYTLTRRGSLAGSIGIDALEIGGSWREGSHHTQQQGQDPGGVFGDTNTSIPDSYVGRPLQKQYLQAGILGPKTDGSGNTHLPTTAVNFYVPEDVALNRETTYTFGFCYADRSKTGVYPLLDVYLNGEKCGETVNPIDRYKPFDYTFPAGTLKPGYNTLMVSNATPPEAVQSLDYYASIWCDYHRFSVKPPPAGMMVIFR